MSRLSLILATLAMAASALASAADASWEYYGGDRGGTRYSQARQITPKNVADLDVAWHYSTGEMHRRSAALITNSSTESTPILFEGSLVVCTPFNRLVSLDPASGRERWAFDAHIDLRAALPYHYNCRGVTPWHDPQAPPGAQCASRIFMGTNDMRLFAIDARTGKPCSAFGDGGAVHVTQNRPSRFAGEIKITSAPAVVSDVVAVGSFVMDNLRTDAPLGTISAFDVRTGAPRWHFDPIPQERTDPAFASWQQESALHTGAANVWSTMTVDAERGLIFAPIGSASPDFWGGERKGDNHYSSSIVALDAASGRLAWSFQQVHHDIFDYDTPSPPMVIDIRRHGALIPAVVQNTKQGFVFVLRRDTGQPVFGVKEQPVPRDAMPGEWLSPTQPFPVAPAPLVPIKAIRPDDAWGFTPWDRAECRKRIATLKSEGIFTPASTAPGTLLTPGNAGGMNWGGPAFDPVRQLMIVNVNTVPQIVILVPRRDIPGVQGITLDPGKDVAAQTGTPYGARREWLLSPWGAPCTAPPWGELVAVEMSEGKVRWRTPLGSIEDKLPIAIPLNYGTPNLGGPIVTAGGLIFIAATMDRYLRAIDIDSGKVLWKHKMKAGTQTTPMTYEYEGRQYVVLVTGHHLWFGSPAGDDILGFALPRH